MPFNGAGVFTPIAAPNYPAVSGTTITALQYNLMVTDLITNGFNNCLTRDGQGKPSASISWNHQNLSQVNNLGIEGDTTSAGNISFTGNTKIFSANFTDANQLLFQTSTANSSTIPAVTPNGSSTVAGWRAYGLPGIANANFIQMYCSNGSISVIESAGSGTFAATPVPLVFSVGSEKLRILSTGQVGVGTTTPAYLSTGVVAVTVEGPTNTAFITSTTAASAVGVVVGSFEGFAQAQTTGFTHIASILYRLEGVTANKLGGAIDFYTQVDGGAVTRKMIIDSNGNVTISGNLLGPTIPFRASKAATTNRTATSIIADPDLVATLSANTNYDIEVYLNAQAANGFAATMTYSGTLPTAALGIIFNPTSGGLTNFNLTSSQAVISGSGTQSFFFKFAIRTTTGGTFAVNWATQTAAATASLLAGSYLRVTPT